MKATLLAALIAGAAISASAIETVSVYFGQNNWSIDLVITPTGGLFDSFFINGNLVSSVDPNFPPGTTYEYFDMLPVGLSPFQVGANIPSVGFTDGSIVSGPSFFITQPIGDRVPSTVPRPGAVPDGGTTAGLLSAAIGALAWAHRKFAA